MRAWLWVAAAVTLCIQAVGSATTISPASVPYCNARPSNVNRAIPPLRPQPQLAATPALIQVQTLIRHGARAPLLGLTPPLGCTGAAWCHEQCGRFFREGGGTGAPIQWLCRPQQLQAWSAGGAVPEQAPISFSPYLETSSNPSLPGNCTEGDLIDVGYLQQAANGRVLRDAYVTGGTGLLDATDLATDTIRVVADHWQRTQASAQALMGGLFPCAGATGCLAGRVFRMGVIPSVGGANLELDLENFLQGSPNCGTAHSSLKHLFEAALPVVPTPALEAVSAAMLDGTPAPPDHVITTAKIGMDGAIECTTDAICNGHPLPDSFSADTFHAAYAAKVQYDSAKWRFSRTLTPASPVGAGLAGTVQVSIAQLTAGNLTARILAEMDTAPAKKLVVWSGHSETLWSFLSAVGVNVTGYPPFASMVNLELYAVQGGERQVRVLWMGSDVTSEIPGCPTTAGSLCPLRTFQAKAGLAVAAVSALCQDPPPAASTGPPPAPAASASGPGTGFGTGSMVAAVVISLVAGGVLATILLVQLARGSGGGLVGRSHGRGGDDRRDAYVTVTDNDPLRYHKLADADADA